MTQITCCTHVEGAALCLSCLTFNAMEAVRSYVSPEDADLPEDERLRMVADRMRDDLEAHPLALLRRHVTGAIARGEAEPIIEQRA